MRMPETILHRWFDEIWNKGNIDAIHELMTPDATIHSLDEAEEDAQGPDEFRQFYERLRGALNPIHVKVIDVLTGPDRIAGIWEVTATHAPTGKPVNFSGISYARIENGKVAEAWNCYDTVKLLRQTGVLPAAPRL